MRRECTKLGVNRVSLGKKTIISYLNKVSPTAVAYVWSRAVVAAVVAAAEPRFQLPEMRA